MAKKGKSTIRSCSNCKMLSTQDCPLKYNNPGVKRTDCKKHKFFDYIAKMNF